jgi:phage/plasmid-associated DNA primase
LKNVSGGDKMPEFRSLYSNEMRSFTSVSKLLLTCNLRPKFNILEHSILRRIKYIHFKSKFILDDNYQIDESKFEYKADVELKDKLSINRFFTLLVNNFKKIYEKQDKLTMCKSCKDEFDNYLIDINPTKGFIKNELYEKEGGKINFKDLFTQYKVYCYDNKITVSGRNVFYDEIRSMLKSKGDYHHGFYVLGYNLISNKNEDEDIQKNDLDV